MLEIDFEKLAKVSMLQAYERLDSFLETPESTDFIIQCKKRHLNSEKQMQNKLLEMYGELLLKNYHHVLAEVLKEEGIHIMDFKNSDCF